MLGGRSRLHPPRRRTGAVGPIPEGNTTWQPIPLMSKRDRSTPKRAGASPGKPSGAHGSAVDPGRPIRRSIARSIWNYTVVADDSDQDADRPRLTDLAVSSRIVGDEDRDTYKAWVNRLTRKQLEGVLRRLGCRDTVSIVEVKTLRRMVLDRSEEALARDVPNGRIWLPGDRMSRTEVMLRVALYLLDTGYVAGDVEVAITGRQLRHGDPLFPAKKFLEDRGHTFTPAAYPNPGLWRGRFANRASKHGVILTSNTEAA